MTFDTPGSEFIIKRNLELNIINAPNDVFQPAKDLDIKCSCNQANVVNALNKHVGQVNVLGANVSTKRLIEMVKGAKIVIDIIGEDELSFFRQHIKYDCFHQKLKNIKDDVRIDDVRDRARRIYHNLNIKSSVKENNRGKTIGKLSVLCCVKQAHKFFGHFSRNPLCQFSLISLNFFIKLSHLIKRIVKSKPVKIITVSSQR